MTCGDIGLKILNFIYLYSPSKEKSKFNNLSEKRKINKKLSKTRSDWPNILTFDYVPATIDHEPTNYLHALFRDTDTIIFIGRQYLNSYVSHSRRRHACMVRLFFFENSKKLFEPCMHCCLIGYLNSWHTVIETYKFNKLPKICRQ